MKVINRLHALPIEQQNLIKEDMKSTLENRVAVMEKINLAKISGR